MSKVKITETVLRDAQQSIMSTKMSTEAIIPMLEKLDDVGYVSIDAWGGAIFDASLRFLNEDPWDRLKVIKSKIKKTPLLMLVRGQSLLGYRHYADDVVELFIRKSIANGIDIVRAYDPLNDLRNLETVFRACKKEGGHIQGTICYSKSPYHSLEGFVKLSKQLYDMGSDSICIKDMAGILEPYEAYNLITAIKEYVKVPIQLHSHCTSGMASMTYLKAIEAGVDMVDSAISPLSMGTSLPATESLIALLQDTSFDTGLDMELLDEISCHFSKVRDTAISNGNTDIKDMGIDINALKYQLPGGMLSSLYAQLKQAGKQHMYDEVLAEVPRVRADFGFPPLVTPICQVIGTQALMNVVAGERYKVVPKETKAILKGEFGKTPGEMSTKIQQLVLGEESPITVRPADIIAPELEAAKSQINGYLEQEEDQLTYLLLPQQALEYFKFRQAGNYKIDGNLVDFEERVHPV